MPSPKPAQSALAISKSASATATSHPARQSMGRLPTAMIRESLNSRFDIALSDLEARTCHSWKMTLDRSKVLATHAGSTQRPQIIIRAAEGCRVKDIDDNAFIDLTMGYGANLLGHSAEVVQQALIDQTREGWNFGLDGEDQLEFAELVSAAGPANERVQICATGNDATALAMRAARAYTGKDVIGVFDGAYHGSHDYALITADPNDLTSIAHIGLGVPERVNDLIKPLPYGAPSAFQRIQDMSDVLAAVIVEPVRGSSPRSDGGAWLSELESVCRDSDVLVILDESLTGFRLAYGGGQERFSLKPDLVTYGKAMAGGLPIGAVAGRKEVMQVFSPGTLRPSVFAGSTFAGNPLSMAAGVATLKYLQSQRESLYATLDRRASALATDLNTFWEQKVAPIHILQCGSILKLVFERPQNETGSAANPMSPQGQDAFFVHLFGQGVALHASGNIYLSTAHSEDDLLLVTGALKYATNQTLEDGLLH